MPIEIDLAKAPRYTPAFPFPDAERGSRLFALNRVHEGTRLVLEDFEGARKRIGGDLNLSQQGKDDALKREAKKLLDRLDKVTASEIQKTEDRIEALENELRSEGEREARENVVVALRAQEVRAWFSGLNASKKLDRVKAAIDDGGPGAREFLSAILSGPRVVIEELLPPRIRQLAEEVVLERRDPVRKRELEELRIALQAVVETRDIVEQHTRSDSALNASLEQRIRLTAQAS